MFGFITTSIPTGKKATAAPRRVSEAITVSITIALLIGLLVLGFAIRLWTYFPHGMAR